MVIIPPAKNINKISSIPPPIFNPRSNNSSVIIPLVLLTKFLSNFIKISWIWIPDYYNPKELFDLGLKIGGGIEDILFIFFAGGIITIFYEALYKREPTKSHIKGHLLSIIGFIISYLIIAVYFTFYLWFFILFYSQIQLTHIGP